MKLTPLVFLPALLPAFALAGTVFFTDSLIVIAMN